MPMHCFNSSHSNEGRAQHGCLLFVSIMAWLFSLLFPAWCIAATIDGDKRIDGDTRIAKWKDDKTAVFLLMFDDGWPSQWQVAVPELVKRGMTATFYINPEKGEYKKFAQEWEDKVWRQGMVYGNHTLTHKGVKDYEDADWEIGECARIIRRITGIGDHALISYGQPGVGGNDWKITPEQTKALLKRYKLIDRPPFIGHGAVYHLQTAQQMLALADKAIQEGSLEYLVIHGVERIKPDWGFQDFWMLRQDVFLPMLDGLASRRDKGELWITDHISAHQYETERASASVEVVKASQDAIELKLTVAADPLVYGAPLTLITKVPSSWRQVGVRQGNSFTIINAANREIRFDAVPNAGGIRLNPTN